MKVLLLILSLLFTQELEVQGDLKVTGNIDAQNNPIKNVGIPTDMNDAINAQILQDALRDNGPFEYTYYGVEFRYATDTSNSFFVRYKGLNSSVWEGDDWEVKITQLSSDGWLVSNVFVVVDGVSPDFVYELKRKIEE